MSGPGAPSSSLRRRVALNAGSNWANLGVTTLTQLLLVPLMLARLGVDAYGVWALLAFGLAYPVILERAFGNAVVHFTAFHRRNAPERNRYVAASLIVMGGVALATLVLAALAAPWVPRAFPAVPTALAGAARTTTLLVGATLAVNMLQSPFAGALKGEQLFTRYNAVMIAANLLRAGGLVVVLLRAPSIQAVQAVYVIAALAALAAMAVDARRCVPGLRLSLGAADLAHVRELWAFTRHSLARSGSRVVMLSSLALLVGRFGTAADVALYDVASKVPQFLNSLMQGAQSVLLPVVSEFGSRGELARVRAVVRKTTAAHLAITLAFTLWLLFDADVLLRLWLRRELDPELGRLVRLLVLTLVPGGAFGLWLPTLVGLGRLRALSIAALVGAVAAVGGAWLLMTRGTAPAFAPAWSMLVVFWIYRAGWLPVYGLRCTEQPAGEYLRVGVLRPLAAAAVAAALLFLRLRLLPGTPDLIAPLLDGVLVAATLGAATWAALRRSVSR